MESGSIKLVVGIGNPGKQYDQTRHNVGFDVVDQLAASGGIKVTKGKFNALWGDGRIGNRKVLLVKPLTYVNLSGGAVAQFVSYYKIEIESLMVVCDDADLELGILRVRRGGSSGGHNGLKSIAGSLGTTDYPRLRIGIGRARDDRQELADHVLGRFDKSELDMARKAIMLASEALQVWVPSGIEEAMNRYNGKIDF